MLPYLPVYIDTKIGFGGSFWRHRRLPKFPQPCISKKNNVPLWKQVFNMLPNRKTKMPPPLKCATDNYTCCLIKRLLWCLWTSWDLSLTIKRGFYPPIPSSSNLNQYMYSHLHKITEQIFIYVYTISCGVVGKGRGGHKEFPVSERYTYFPPGEAQKDFFPAYSPDATLNILYTKKQARNPGHVSNGVQEHYASR